VKLIPLRDQTLNWLFSDDYLATLGNVHGLPRLHASIEGNALWAMLRLDLADDRAEALAERLRNSQLLDGGWNCDRKASGRSDYKVGFLEAKLSTARLRSPLVAR
jgi:hypothetical protein